MPIVSSIVIEDARQADGRRQIVELHTDDIGLEHRVSYLAASDTVIDLATSAKRIVKALVERAEHARLDGLYTKAQGKVDAWLISVDLQAEAGLTTDEEAEIKVRLL